MSVSPVDFLSQAMAQMASAMPASQPAPEAAPDAPVSSSSGDGQRRERFQDIFSKTVNDNQEPASKETPKQPWHTHAEKPVSDGNAVAANAVGEHEAEYGDTARTGQTQETEAPARADAEPDLKSGGIEANVAQAEAGQEKTAGAADDNGDTTLAESLAGLSNLMQQIATALKEKLGGVQEAVQAAAKTAPIDSNTQIPAAAQALEGALGQVAAQADALAENLAQTAAAATGQTFPENFADRLQAVENSLKAFSQAVAAPAATPAPPTATQAVANAQAALNEKLGALDAQLKHVTDKLATLGITPEPVADMTAPIAETVTEKTTKAVDDLKKLISSGPLATLASTPASPLAALAKDAAAPAASAKDALAVQPLGTEEAVVAQAVGDAQASANTGNESGDSSAFQQNTPSAPAVTAGLSTASAQQTHHSQPSFAKVLTAQGAAPMSEQLAFHMKTAVNEGNSRITIQLDPAELGKLELRLDVGADGKASMVITADNRQALDMLQRDMRGLQQALQDSGLKTDAGSLSFNLRGDQNNQGGQPQQQRNAYGYAQSTEPEDDYITIASKGYVLNVRDGLDIRI